MTSEVAMQANRLESPSSKVNRIVNGYRLLYKPDHPYCMKSKNWYGYVYEHRYLMERYLGRKLSREEHVHHLDCNRLNNSWDNLILLNSDMHKKLHAWIDAGAPIYESSGMNGVNSEEAKADGKEAEQTAGMYSPSRYCSCGTTLSKGQKKFCSWGCYESSSRSCAENARGIPRPSSEQLLQDVSTMSMVAVGRKYGVSDNAVRKWLSKLSVKPTLSQAGGTPPEGAETSGEVQPS